MRKQIAVLPGDGIGEEVMIQAVRVLACIGELFDHQLVTTTGYVGGAAWNRFGSHLPQETIDLCTASDGILFGSVGGPISEQNLPHWQNCERNSILALRKYFEFNVNLRPVKLYPQIQDSCPLKLEIVQQGVNILFIRELLGDSYFGKKTKATLDGIRFATDESRYTEVQIASVAEVAFRCARERRGKVTSIDKANVLETSRLWRCIVGEVSKRFPDVSLEHMLVDNCAMQIIKAPGQFDVVLAPNMFGDILTDQAAALAGSLGMLASASINSKGQALYEPSGGSAPDIAGKGIANPIAQILCCAMMLKHSFGLHQEAQAIESAIQDVLSAGYRTFDIHSSGTFLVRGDELTNRIIQSLQKSQQVRSQTNLTSSLEVG